MESLYSFQSSPSVGATTASFKYDPFGRRIYKSSSTGTSVFAYDGDNLIEETNASGGVVARYAQQGLNIDEPLAMLRSGTTSYYQVDGLKTVTSLSNTAGALAQTYTFDSFGRQTASSGSLTNPFQYTGREFDTESSLYYVRARYFDPATGRFASEDPIGFWGGNNFYVYVRNNPVKWTDPLGLAPTQCCKQEEPQLRQQADNARQRVDALASTGTAVLPGGSGKNKPCAATSCSLTRIPGTNNYFASADTYWYPECQNLSPCVRRCKDAHEGVHRRMCTRLGGLSGLSEYALEYPAYMTELGCYIKTLRDAGLNP